MADDVVLERALRAIGRMRSHGLNFYGQFLGIKGRAGDGTSNLEIPGEPPSVGAPEVSIPALAVLADLTLSASMRGFLDPGMRTVTVAMSIQHPHAGIAGPVTAEAAAVRAGEGFATASGTLVSSNWPIGRAEGLFALAEAPEGFSRGMSPWEERANPLEPPTMEELTELEADAVNAAILAAQRAVEHGTAVSQELLPFAWQEREADHAAGTLQIGSALANRAGHIQGGLLYGAGALAATQALGVKEAVLGTGHYQFHRPADGGTLAAEATVLRRGKTVAFVEARIRVDEQVVGVGLYTFRLPGAERPRPSIGGQIGSLSGRRRR